MHLITSQFREALPMNKEPFIQLSSLGLNGIKGGLKKNLFTSGKDQITGYSSRHCAQVWEGSWVARQNLDVLNRSLVSKTFFYTSIFYVKAASSLSMSCW